MALIPGDEAGWPEGMAGASRCGGLSRGLWARPLGVGPEAWGGGGGVRTAC
jgi:hypothetical protein